MINHKIDEKIMLMTMGKGGEQANEQAVLAGQAQSQALICIF